ncbi:IS3 family transposase [Candidatus Uabimicrobium sp. HlEnr_7]|uniref:IS3 family transposase n=1 Tax=Candidatus Uabimicrobium helgolandensis TaxID=3095367 RepID=UPI00355750BE
MKTSRANNRSSKKNIPNTRAVRGRERYEIMKAVAILANDIGVVEACKSFGIARASWYRWKNGGKKIRKKGCYPHALTKKEKENVLEILNSERFVDMSPREVYAILLDEGKYLCSYRTMYRLLHDQESSQERRKQRQHRNYEKPELLATAPNCLWSWDISKLKGPRKWNYFYLYVILDVYSRCVVGWTIAEKECKKIASDLIEETTVKQKIPKGQLTIHADRGASMRSKNVALLLSDLGITKTHSRPYVSNDNPFSESQFKTLKYRPDFPERFGSIQDARSFCRTFFLWYNKEHRHTGIALFTPEMVHYGQVQHFYNIRKDTLYQAYLQNPGRFRKGISIPKLVPDAVWINPPKQNSI